MKFNFLLLLSTFDSSDVTNDRELQKNSKESENFGGYLSKYNSEYFKIYDNLLASIRTLGNNMQNFRSIFLAWL